MRTKIGCKEIINRLEAELRIHEKKYEQRVSTDTEHARGIKQGVEDSIKIIKQLLEEIK